METVLEDVKEGKDTVLIPIGEDEGKSVAMVETSKQNDKIQNVNILADATEKEIPTHLMTDKEIDKPKSQDINTKKNDMIEQDNENVEDNEIDGT